MTRNERDRMVFTTDALSAADLEAIAASGMDARHNDLNAEQESEMAANRLGRDAPLPQAMQGRWVAIDEPASELLVDGGKITSFGQEVAYDYKDVIEQDGALTVSLGTADKSNEDAFQRANITRLVITPEGRFFVYNVRFSSEFVRVVSG